ncbi:hypothetical protein [Nocardiopsis tropica]|jgi:hypothetical protein|uniref:IstB-like ATP-binding protein domain-containing protein n=1 Tax=Nocardiopsis tropica TaxID=109330 RepID=A0ABU7KT32_9ACTN|nr:hypothetical protein [Nocardiopsis umidischolae]MEE2052451.1 hypothetical protein [Nocardiopsis umidischolae]
MFLRLFDQSEADAPVVRGCPFVDAAADQWCDPVLSDATTRILLLGPVGSSKIHHAYAMFKRILDAGHPPNDISVHSLRLQCRGPQ